MCGRLACTLCPDDIAKKCQYMNKEKQVEKPKWLDSQYEYRPVYNGPPTTVLPVLSHKNNFPDVTKGDFPEYCLVAMRWGMLLRNNPEGSANYHTHNARLENVSNSNLYKPCLLSGRRCVVLADGYYEWKTTTGENHKQPYFLYQAPESKDKKHLMRFAGLFNLIRDDMGVRHSCTILTTQSDSKFEWLHHRMPVILNTDEDVENWLNCNNFSYEKALRNLPKYSSFPPEYELKYHIVEKEYVNKTSCNEEKCMLEVQSKKRKSSTLDGWLKRTKK